MPFDTTYNFIYDSLPDQSLMITIAGGNDTFINLKAEELPKLLLRYPQISEHLNQREPIYFEPKTNDGFGIQFLQFTFILTVFILVYNIFRNLPSWKKAFEKSLAAKIVFLLFFTYLGIKAVYSSLPEFGWLLLILTALIVFEFKYEIFISTGEKDDIDEEISLVSNTKAVNKPVLKYDGATLNFTDIEIDNALTKRFPYYVALSYVNKERFIHRVKNFIADKIFYIHDKSGFKEMPILISAAAIQLTFGLKKYMLPYFKNIHVYPEEFFRSNNMGICFLEGNVSSNNINLSWKHFLKGYEKSNDGQNVGLHELAHALYYQTFVVGQNVDDDFRNSYNNFIDNGNKVYQTEKTVAGGLYSEYAVTDFQEFWAESAEIYFERPAELKELYPVLYDVIKNLLNQDLLNQSNLPIS